MEILLTTILLLLTLAAISLPRADAATDPGDYAVLNEFRKSLLNPEILKWPEGSTDPCGPPAWPHLFCDGGRVSQIQAQNAGLVGALPPSFPRLTALTNLGLQNNHLSGPLPSFKNLAQLKYAFLNGNSFSSIPADFFVGLASLLDLSLDGNPLNASSGGWMVPEDLAASSAQLVNLTLMNCSLVGQIPEFLGRMQSLQMLQLSYNSLSGPIPASFNGSNLQVLWLNNQLGDQKLSRTLDVVATMTSLQDVWLHGNQFSGPIPTGIGACVQLWRIWLNNNELVGVVPKELTGLPKLQSLQLDNNMLMGLIPKVKYNFTYSGNAFCAATPGVDCSPAVMALLDFLEHVGYPNRLARSWSGNDPCASWTGVSCVAGSVTVINLPKYGLNGTISPLLRELAALTDIVLSGNNLTGTVPDSLTGLKALKKLDVSSNNLEPPLPVFANGVKVVIDGNQYLNGKPMPSPSSPGNSPPSPGGKPSPSSPGSTPHAGGGGGTKKSSTVLVIAIPVSVSVVLMSLAAGLFFCRKKKRGAIEAPASVVVHPRNSSDPDNTVKIVVANNASHGGASNGDEHSWSSARASDVHVIEAGNYVVSVQVLRNATKNFAQENVLGRGGFGVVYKGVLHDGTMIAVKRMEASVISNKALDEFQAEIACLTKVRHRNLVSILGYSIEGSERLLVYEFMPHGALSKHLFHWKQLDMEPLSWKKRLNVALDVARGMEYLHNLAHQCFIHRDLKSANILLADDFRAKVSDFGLVKLAPDGKFSVATRLAGTFGYLAPEYAVTGKITTKADVFSFGVVLMEMITGLTALDESRPEETRYLASWFCQIRNNQEKLKAAIDPALDVNDETFESISVIAELAGHCAAREPHQRPDMGHAVNVLVPMVEKWKPVNDETEDYMGIDLHQPLLQMVKGWQAAEGSITDGSILSLNDSKGSIPARPAGFAESFTSADGR